MKCFVIQPFDDGVFDKRYEDIFAPAITKAGLIPYRVDKDPTTTIPIEDIEREIDSANICLAEISSNNPNVWYELGYAIAKGKEAILLCDKKERDKFPFDIQHRTIIIYKNESLSDFNSLAEQITERIVALVTKEQKLQKVTEVLDKPKISDTHGLSPNEMFLMISVVENQFSMQPIAPVYRVRQDMDKAGYTNAATNLAVMKLTQKKLIESFEDYDPLIGENFEAIKLTEVGLNWIIENEDKFSLKKEPKSSISTFDDEIPF